MTDSFGRAVNIGDEVWVPMTVVGFQGSDIAGSFTNVNGTNTTLTIAGGSGSQVSNPAEGDRPPR
jgi:hypothetical protein